MAYKLVPRIKRSGWPVFTRSGKVSKEWKKAHPAANREVLKRFGSKTAKAVNKIKVPNTELLGSHTRAGKIKISSRVPKKLRAAIAHHERVEHRLMKKKKRRSKK